MTECDRIIDSGILKESFFYPESICDFYVDENRKKIWAIVLDLLIKFDLICRKYNLRYTLIYGALLGAIRHSGFIPWDDDLDVCMPREDYEKFIQVAQNELESPYFLQLPGKDNDYFFSFAKLRNSNTSSISKSFRYAKFNQGIFLDIFVLDNVILEEAENNYNQIKHLILENSANMRRSNLNPSLKDIERIQAYPPSNPFEVQNKIDTLCTRFNNIGTEYATISNIVVYPFKNQIFKWNDLRDLTTISMYGHEFYVPRNYDRILSIIYGDYMKYPPIKDRGNWHNDSVFDPDVPYNDTLENLYKIDLQNK
jgi:lipopolysaccharide cholinephosphotransferase